MSKTAADVLEKVGNQYNGWVHISEVMSKEEALKQLYELCVAQQKVYHVKSTNGIMNEPNTGVLAVPVEALREIFGVSDEV